MSAPAQQGSASALPATAAPVASGVLHIEARGAGPDLRPGLIAMGAVRQRGAPAAEAGDVRSASLATLAEAASHWLAADNLADAYDQTDEALSALVAVAARIMREAAAIPADTREALRSKAQILVRIEGAALRDDASMTTAGQALLTSLLADLTGEADAV